MWKSWLFFTAPKRICSFKCRNQSMKIQCLLETKFSKVSIMTVFRLFLREQFLNLFSFFIRNPHFFSLRTWSSFHYGSSFDEISSRQGKVILDTWLDFGGRNSSFWWRWRDATFVRGFLITSLWLALKKSPPSTKEPEKRFIWHFRGVKSPDKSP